jgi:hypothetical protein
MYCSLWGTTKLPPSEHPPYWPWHLTARSQWRSRKKKNLVIVLFSLCSTRFIPLVSVGLHLLPSCNGNCHGQHGHGGVIFTKFEKYASRQQSTEMKLYGLLAIILLLRLVPRDYYLVVVLCQNKHCHGQGDA